MDLFRFTSAPKNILEQLYETREPEAVVAYEDFLKLPVTPEYAKKQLEVEEDKQINPSTLTEEESKELHQQSIVSSGYLNELKISDNNIVQDATPADSSKIRYFR